MPQPKVSIADGVTGDKATVTSGGLLKVDIGDNIELTVDDVVTAEQDTPEDLKVLIHGHSDGGVYYPIQCNADGKITLDPASTVNMSGLVFADTELKTPAVLADDTANPTITQISTYPMVYDGSTWDMMRGTSANGLLVDLGANNDVTVSGTATVTQAGNVTVDQSSTARTVTCDTAGNLLATVTQDSAERTITGTVSVAGDVVLESGSTTIVSEIEETVTVTQAGDVNIGTMPDVTVANPFDGAVTGTFWQSTQPVSGSVTVQGEQSQNAAIVDDPIICGAENFGNDWSTIPAISTNNAVRLITDGGRALYTRSRGWKSWENHGPLALDGTVEQLSDFGGGLGLQNDCYEIILQTSATNDGYVAILAGNGGDLDEGIRMDAGDTLVLPLFSTGSVFMKSSDNTQTIKVTIVK